MGDKAALLARRRMMEDLKKTDENVDLEEDRIKNVASTFGGVSKAASQAQSVNRKPALSQLAEQSPGMSSPFSVGCGASEIVNPAIPAELASKISARRRDVDSAINQNKFQQKVAAAPSGDDDFKRLMEVVRFFISQYFASLFVYCCMNSTTPDSASNKKMNYQQTDSPFRII